MLNSSGESGIPVLFQIWVRRLSVFPHWGLYLLWVYPKWLWLYSGMFPLYPLWRGSWSWRDVELCQMLFLCLLRWSYDFWLFFLLMWCMILIDLHMLNHPCAPGMNPTRSLCMIFFICCWIRLAKILLRIFASIFIKDIGL